jgi:hypothetical protein
MGNISSSSARLRSFYHLKDGRLALSIVGVSEKTILAGDDGDGPTRAR